MKKRSTNRTPARRTVRRTDTIAVPRKLWLASLGVAALAQKQGEQAVEQIADEAGKLRAKADRALVDARKSVDNARKQAKRTVDAYVKPLKKRAEKAAKHVEITVADQVGAAIGKLGIPSKNEVAALLSRVEQLRKQVQAKARARAR